MLLESMDSPDVSVRCAVASALGYLGKKHLDEVGSVLVRHLDDDDPLVRSEVIDALAALEYADSVAPLRRKLQDADSLVRASAAEALGDLNEPTALQDLVNAFADSDEAVRAFSVRAYGLLAPSGQTLALAERSKLEPSSFVLAELEAARCRLDETSTLEPVLEALSLDFALPGWPARNVGNGAVRAA
jgi:HEAT repeat protein